MSTLDRIAEIAAEGEAAVSAASDTAALEELRVQYLGRRAELPQLLRGVAELPPEQRGAVGSAANRARQALTALIESRLEALAGVLRAVRGRGAILVALPLSAALAARSADRDGGLVVLALTVDVDGQ